MVNAGVTWRIGEGTTKAYPSKDAMAQEIDSLRSVVDDQNNKLAAQNSELAAQNTKIESQSEQLAAQTDELKAQRQQLDEQSKQIEQLMQAIAELKNRITRVSCKRDIAAEGPSFQRVFLWQFSSFQRDICKEKLKYDNFEIGNIDL